MNNLENYTAAAKITKKDVRKMIYERLAIALGDYKNGIKEKRFNGNLKKASKLLADDILKAKKKAMKPAPGKTAFNKLKDSESFQVNT